MLQSQPLKTYRVTWDELMSHRSEIAPDAVLEVRVYEPQADPENQTLINLLHSWREEDDTDDSQEMQRRDAETSTLLNNLQANRLSLRGPEAKPVVSAKNAAAFAYLNQRIAEEATNDPEEIRKADAEVKDLMDNLNRNRIKG